MFDFRQLTEEDYPTLVEWWGKNKFPPPLQSVLPNNGTGGVMISKDGIDICAGFVYDTNSELAWIEFIVANFEVKDRGLRKEALNFLIEKLLSICTNKKAVFTSVKNRGLINRLEDCGFIVGSNNTVEMIKIL